MVMVSRDIICQSAYVTHLPRQKIKKKKNKKKKIDMSFQLKCVKKVTEAIMLLFFVDQVNCSAGESTMTDGH